MVGLKVTNPCIVWEPGRHTWLSLYLGEDEFCLAGYQGRVDIQTGGGWGTPADPPPLAPPCISAHGCPLQDVRSAQLLTSLYHILRTLQGIPSHGSLINPLLWQGLKVANACATNRPG